MKNQLTAKLAAAIANRKNEMAHNKIMNEGGQGYNHEAAADAVTAVLAEIVAAGYFVRRDNTLVDKQEWLDVATKCKQMVDAAGAKTIPELNKITITMGWTYTELIDAKNALNNR